MVADHSIDKTIPIPLYFQLKNIIINEIDNMQYHAGDMIPTEKELSELFQISRTTVRQAITELVQEGRLYRVKSKGTFVTRPKIQQDFIRKLENYSEQIRRFGGTPSTQVLHLTTVIMPENLVAPMQAHPGDLAVDLYRLRMVDDEPNVVVRTFLPYNRCSFVLSHDFENESLYDILSSQPDTRIWRVKRTMEAVLADEDDALLLGISEGDAVHSFITSGYNAEGDLIEYSYARYRGDRNRFEVEVYVETGKNTHP